ncbi:CGNR zinc finger domain-containing protein [Asanoa sp. NPDC050611]|uniref:CGNR zinc finger domain-containing protein n=1 Tax=Asanoa sp. NPDC050611 TaxID=3157098 RepID=UPI0033CC50A3
MHLNPYGTDPVQLAADLANAPPRSLAELTTRCASAGLVMDMPVRESDLADVIALIEEWRSVVDAPSSDARASALNQMLAAAATYPRLSRHSNEDWHLHYRDDGVPLSAVLRALVSVGTALHLTQRGMDRLGRCAGDGCETIYADVSRAGRQRYCSPRCANRDAVRRHRTRYARQRVG